MDGTGEIKGIQMRAQDNQGSIRVLATSSAQNYEVKMKYHAFLPFGFIPVLLLGSFARI
jgi:hypothetical protein